MQPTTPTPMVIQRREVKYRMTQAQKAILLETMAGHMEPDSYGRCEIRSLYFDTPDFLLARRSWEKPLFKEKLRLRSYGPAAEDSTVYLEVKRKFDSLVYKRRIALPYGQAMACLLHGAALPDSQIGRELEYARNLYRNPVPAAYIRCMREAYFDPAGTDFRVTFDDSLVYRREALTLKGENWGQPMLSENEVLMELKIPDSYPLWMARALSELELFPTSYSKYGAVWDQVMMKGWISNAG